MNSCSQHLESNPRDSEDSRILDAALEMATGETGWYDLSLVDLARRCGVPVNGVRRYYADTNAIANAWFSRALEAMLAPMPEGFEAWPIKERLEFVIWRWF